MNRFFAFVGIVGMPVLVCLWVRTYGSHWEFGQKYNMPVAILAPDGRHYPDGEALDPFTALIVQSGCEEEIWLGFVGFQVACWGLLAQTLKSAKKMCVELDNQSLDVGLMQWNRHDWFTRRHLLNGGVIVYGRPGSGKTSGSGETFGRAIVGDKLSSLLVLAAKPEDAEMWRTIFADKGRELIEISPEGKNRCNLLEFIQRHGGDTREIVSFIFTSAESLRGEQSSGGEYGAFFQDQERRFMHFCVELLRQAGVAVSIPNIQRFISGAALSVQQRNSAEWREGFHNQVLRKAAEKQKTPIEQHDYEIANVAWAKEWVLMADKTRSCVLGGMLNKLFHFNTGFVRELVSTTTNCSPMDLLKGKSILINCPSSEYGESGTLVSTAWKYIVQKTILARTFKPGDFYVTLWADEAWQTVTSFDQHFAATSRSHGGAMVYLLQSRDSLYSALKGKDGQHYANTLMGMFHHRIFHALGSAEDAQYASSLLGQRRETFINPSSQPPEDIFDAVWKGGHFSTSSSQSYQPAVQPAVFLNGMRCGGRENKGLVDAIVIRSGEPFHNKENWMFCTFQQR